MSTGWLDTLSNQCGETLRRFSRALDAPLRAPLFLVLVSLIFFLPGISGLQPMDRDEPRFAQATKQMLESGNLVEIRFQDEARNKKPIGIHWVQAAAVSLGERLGVEEARRTIGLYRIPSLIGAVATVLFAYVAALLFVSRKGAMLVGLLMASTLLLNAEARLAKTDALLTATIVGSMAILARTYLHAATPHAVRAPGLGLALVFWIALTAGILIKGPIHPLVIGLAVVVLSFRERSMDWLAPLRATWGLPLAAILVLPWLVAIYLATDGAFFREAIGQDMLAKVAGGQENHGAPPGTYLAVTWATAWPLAPFLAIAAPFAWRERDDDGVALLLAWALPMWLVFELVPTKLPHYVLPLLPALAIVLVLALERGIAPNRVGLKILALVVGAVPLAIAGGMVFAAFRLEDAAPFARVPPLAVPGYVLASAMGIAAAASLWRAEIARAMGRSMLAALVLVPTVIALGLPDLSAINLSRRLANAAEAAQCARPSFFTAGYREPSLVFLTASDLNMVDGAGAARGLDAPGDGCRIAFVDAREEAAFRAALTGASAPALITRVRGVNLNAALDKARRLRILDIAVYVRR